MRLRAREREMFDIGWSEMTMILTVALVVIGPKDLPRVARQIGRWTAKGRALAREFQRSIDDMAREADLQDIKDDIAKMGRGGLGQTIERTIDPDGEMRRAIEAPSEKPLRPDRETVSSAARDEAGFAGVEDHRSEDEVDDVVGRSMQDHEPVEVLPVAAGDNAATMPPNEPSTPAPVEKN